MCVVRARERIAMMFDMDQGTGNPHMALSTRWLHACGVRDRSSDASANGSFPDRLLVAKVERREVNEVHMLDRRRCDVFLELHGMMFQRNQTTAMASDERPESVGRRALLIAFAAIALATVPRRGMAAHPGTSQEVDGLAIYLAIIPAAFVLDHPPEHTGRDLHGNASDDRYAHHLIVALFDSATGKRITNAVVTAIVTGGLHPSQGPIQLGPMTIGGAQAYGGFASLPPRDRYRIEIEVVRPAATAVRAIFAHQHLQPQP